MAKVLRYGRVQPQTTLCPNCEALIEYTHADLDYTALACHFDEEKIGLLCPACGKMMTVEYYRDGLHCVRQENGKFQVIEEF
jgi:primosomal protein N'